MMLGQPITKGLRRFTGSQRDPRGRGVTAGYQSLGKRLPKELGGGYQQLWS